jgi:hypothetical protein
MSEAAGQFEQQMAFAPSPDPNRALAEDVMRGSLPLSWPLGTDAHPLDEIASLKATLAERDAEIEAMRGFWERSCERHADERGRLLRQLDLADRTLREVQVILGIRL